MRTLSTILFRTLGMLQPIFFQHDNNNSYHYLFFLNTIYNCIIIPFWNYVKYFLEYNEKNILKRNYDSMKIRKQTYGTKNLVGRNIELLRKKKGIKQKDFIAQIQIMGCDMNPTSYSKLEGQVRSATDKEIYVISKVLGVSMEALFEES